MAISHRRVYIVITDTQRRRRRGKTGSLSTNRRLCKRYIYAPIQAGKFLFGKEVVATTSGRLVVDGPDRYRIKELPSTARFSSCAETIFLLFSLSLSVSSEVLRSAKVSEALETSPVLFFDVRLGDVGVHRKELMGNCGSDFFYVLLFVVIGFFCI